MEKIKHLHVVCALWMSTMSIVTLQAQEQLPEVVISSPRLGISIGSNDWRMDSIPYKTGVDLNIADALVNESSVYIRSYGPGIASTISLKGFSPSQTVVYWNGLPLNSPALGLTDLSTIPLGSKIELDDGNAGAMYGSAYMGGGVQVYSNTLVQNAFEVSSTQSVRSSGFYDHRSKISFKAKLTGHHVGFISQLGPMNYLYTDLYGVERRRIGADQSNQHVTYEGNWQKAGKRLTWGFWGSVQDRGIPNNISQVYEADARQYDQNARAYLRFESKHARYGYHVQTGHYFENQRYDSKIVTDTNLAWAQYSDASVYYHLTENLTWTSSVEHTWQMVEGTSKSRSDIHRFGLGNQVEGRFFKRRLSVVGGLKVEHQNGQTPVLPSVSLAWEGVSKWNIQASYRQHFRFPTLNDMFWTPGGNPDLSPERGYTYDLKLQKAIDLYGLRLTIPWDVYYSNVSDYILWVPGGAYFSPQNVRKVELYGGSLGVRAQWKIAKTNWSLGASGSYNHTTTLESTNLNDPTLNNQLIYTPKYRATGDIKMSFGNWAVWGRSSANSIVYTTTDNDPRYGIPAFYIIDAGVDWRKSFSQFNLNVTGSVLNLTNVAYSYQRFYPMPGIQGALTVKIQFKYEGH